MKVMIQNSAIKGNREFHVRPHKDLEMITLMLLCKIIDLQKKNSLIQNSAIKGNQEIQVR